jgi:hypothetical protein
MKTASRQAALWAGVILGTLLLFGCSSDSTPDPVVSEAASFPFGLQSSAVTSDWDGDGLWDERTTTTFSYNAFGSVVAVSVTDEEDFDADGLPDYRTTTATTYDPNLVAATPIFAIITAAKRPLSPEGLGAVLSETYQMFSKDAAGSLILERASTSTYTYDLQGHRLGEERLSEEDNDLDGIHDRSTNSIYSYQFNAAGNPLGESRIHKTDEDGDGVFDYISTDEWTWTYTADGKPLTYLQVSAGDADGDGVGAFIPLSNNSRIHVYDAQGSLLSYNAKNNFYDTMTGALTSSYIETETYANTYTDGLLTQAVVSVYEDGNISSHTITYGYDLAGNLTEVKYFYDYSANGLADAWDTTTLSYDAAGRQTSQHDRSEIDHNEDGTLDQWHEYFYTWNYDAAGRLSSCISGYQAGEDNTPVFFNNYNSEVLYTFENDLLTRFSNIFQQDNNSDGLFDYRYASTYTYNYIAGLLTDHRWDEENDSTLGTPGDETHSSTGRSFTYQNGDLTGIYSWSDQDGDGTPESTDKTTISYDASGRVTGTVTEGDWDGDTVIDSTEALVLTNDAAAKTVAIETSMIYSPPPALPTMVAPSAGYLLTFGANGIPTGTMDAQIGSVGLSYPEGHENYLITMKVPKIIGILDALNINTRK